MRSIHYTDSDFVTGSAIALAVIEYAQALAESSESATVDIPIVDGSGTIVDSTILLGPASQIITTDLPDFEGDELEDAQLVEDLKRRAAAIARPAANALPSVAQPGWPEFDDLT